MSIRLHQESSHSATPHSTAVIIAPRTPQLGSSSAWRGHEGPTAASSHRAPWPLSHINASTHPTTTSSCQPAWGGAAHTVPAAKARDEGRPLATNEQRGAEV